ncbi:hypothetical protein L6270_01195 [Candidatus Parcubacteria bacterium]|nr:hypothetical protein [Candidatus Parcubacteria bacterium]
MHGQNIGFSSEVSLDSVQCLLKMLQKKRGGGQMVWIDSPGGSFEFFSTLAPFLLQHSFTSVCRDVRSAAVILFLLGKKRLVLPDGVFFFHEVRAISNDGHEITICDLDAAIDWENERLRSLRREWLEEERIRMRNAQNWMLAFISEQSGISRSTFLSLMRAEATLSAREAVHYGLAHRIVSEDELGN